MRSAERGVWLEIRLRLRASSKLFSRHFLDRTRAFSGISRRATTKGVSTEEVFPNQFANLVAQPHRALMRYEIGLLAKTEKRLRQLCPSDNVFKPDVRLLSRVHPKVALRALFLTLVILQDVNAVFGAR